MDIKVINYLNRIIVIVKDIFNRFTSAWLDEFKLISKIWNNRYPEPDEEDKIPISVLEKCGMSCLVFIRSLSLNHLKNLFDNYRARSEFSEFYVLVWFIILILLLWFPFQPLWLLILIVIYRLIDGFNYRLCVLFVDRYEPDWGLRSISRTLFLILINYLEIIIGFGILFLQTHSIGYVNITSKNPEVLTSPIQAFYFSTVTITTLGDGDFTPLNDIGKILITFEVILGFVFIALVLGLFITGVQFVKEIDAKGIKKE